MHFILSLALCSTVSLGYNLQGLEDISNYSPEQTYKKLESVRLKVDNLEQRMESVRVKVDKLEQRMEGLSPTSNLGNLIFRGSVSIYLSIFIYLLIYVYASM